MRALVIVCAGALALSACGKKEDAAKTGETADAAASAPAAAGPATPPKRKPGLWKQTVSAGGTTQESKLCLDEATEAKMTLWGQAVGKDICAKNTITPAPGGWKLESDCDFGESGRNVSTGTITGDFASKYVLKMTTTTTGAKMVQANGTQDMEMTGTWEGACPADMKPGDMTLPGGLKVNIANMPGMK
ncbi:MAG: DUF3617 family protein [Pseudomonadota bacterium]